METEKETTEDEDMIKIHKNAYADQQLNFQQLNAQALELVKHCTKVQQQLSDAEAKIAVHEATIHGLELEALDLRERLLSSRHT